MDFIKKSAACLFLIYGLFVGVSKATASETLTIPAPIKHDGLAFSQPLTIDNPESLNLKPLSVEFITNEESTSGESPIPTDIEPEKLSIVPTTPAPTKLPAKTPPVTQAPTSVPTSAPAQSYTLSTGGLNADVLFNMSNTYRAGLGLAPFQRDDRICSLAAARAPQIAAEIAGGYMHAGKDSHGFPYRVTENIITMRSEAEAFNWWVNDYIHRVQIEQSNTHSCVACAGNACTQVFTSYQPR